MEKVISASWLQVRLAYEHYYKKDMPMDLPYVEALKQMAKEFGFDTIYNWIQNCPNK